MLKKFKIDSIDELTEEMMAQMTPDEMDEAMKLFQEVIKNVENENGVNNGEAADNGDESEGEDDEFVAQDERLAEADAEEQPVVEELEGEAENGDEPEYEGEADDELEYEGESEGEDDEFVAQDELVAEADAEEPVVEELEGEGEADDELEYEGESEGEDDEFVAQDELVAEADAEEPVVEELEGEGQSDDELEYEGESEDDDEPEDEREIGKLDINGVNNNVVNNGEADDKDVENNFVLDENKLIDKKDNNEKNPQIEEEDRIRFEKAQAYLNRLLEEERNLDNLLKKGQGPDLGKILNPAKGRNIEEQKEVVKEAKKVIVDNNVQDKKDDYNYVVKNVKNAKHKNAKHKKVNKEENQFLFNYKNREKKDLRFEKGNLGRHEAIRQEFSETNDIEVLRKLNSKIAKKMLADQESNKRKNKNEESKNYRELKDLKREVQDKIRNLKRKMVKVQRLYKK